MIEEVKNEWVIIMKNYEQMTLKNNKITHNDSSNKYNDINISGQMIKDSTVGTILYFE